MFLKDLCHVHISEMVSWVRIVIFLVFLCTYLYICFEKNVLRFHHRQSHEKFDGGAYYSSQCFAKLFEIGPRNASENGHLSHRKSTEPRKRQTNYF